MDKWFENLDSEDMAFIKKFVLSSGSLKKISAEYDVSYPTIRLRLDRLIQKIELNENETNHFKNKIMQLVIDNHIDFDIANKIIEIYNSERGENNND